MHAQLVLVSIVMTVLSPLHHSVIIACRDTADIDHEI